MKIKLVYEGDCPFEFVHGASEGCGNWDLVEENDMYTKLSIPVII